MSASRAAHSLPSQSFAVKRIPPKGGSLRESAARGGGNRSGRRNGSHACRGWWDDDAWRPDIV